MMTKAKVAGNYVSSILAKTGNVAPSGREGSAPIDTWPSAQKKSVCRARRPHLNHATGRDESRGHHARHADTQPPTWPCRCRGTHFARPTSAVANEVLVCGTAAEVIGLREIDFRTIGSGKSGPVTRALQQEFDKLVSENIRARQSGPALDGWCERTGDP